jgi:hypothetical protein
VVKWLADHPRKPIKNQRMGAAASGRAPKSAVYPIAVRRTRCVFPGCIQGALVAFGARKVCGEHLLRAPAYWIKLLATNQRDGGSSPPGGSK